MRKRETAISEWQVCQSSSPKSLSFRDAHLQSQLSSLPQWSAGSAHGKLNEIGCLVIFDHDVNDSRIPGGFDIEFFKRSVQNSGPLIWLEIK